MPTKDTIITGVKIEHLERLYNSSNGNPRYRVTFDSGLVADTQSDAAVNYSIANRENGGVPLVVTLTPAGRIRYLTPYKPGS